MRSTWFKKARDECTGFTLIEVLMAVSLLGLGLTTLIGVQTGFANQYLRERDLTRAALYAQYLISGIEGDGKVPSEGEKDSDLESALRDAGYFEGLDNADGEKLRESMATWKVLIRTEKIDLPPMEDALRRIEVLINWGESELDNYSVVYFMRGTAKLSFPVAAPS
ncbi:MAG: prepilin-type N-terminal cleavage/methylation domain-containing protein [Deltaproteobacteria bacterium]|nr:prepilin-type N-terminal cleavage/methylation domain-containing protein [Deltaproteobacteria bacterium]